MTTRFLIIFFLSISTLSVCQIGNLKIYDGKDYKCNLHQFNDTLVYLTFEEFNGFSSYYLGKFQLSKDSLVIHEVLDLVVIKSDVYFSNDNSISKDSLVIDYMNGDFIIPCRYYNLDSVIYKVDGITYNTKKGDVTGSVQSMVERPDNQTLSIQILDSYGSLLKTKVEIPKDFNKVQFKEFSVFSLPSYYTPTFQELIPSEIEIDGKKLKLSILLK